MEPNEVISTAEVARRLRIDRSAVVKRVAAGDLIPFQKLEGRTGAYLFLAADFPQEPEAVAS